MFPQGWVCEVQEKSIEIGDIQFLERSMNFYECELYQRFYLGLQRLYSYLSKKYKDNLTWRTVNDFFVVVVGDLSFGKYDPKITSSHERESLCQVKITTLFGNYINNSTKGYETHLVSPSWAIRKTHLEMQYLK